ncbi:putative inactive receptor kinase [Cinnamomum micranthum f. kanehirae]|uniref:Putative inactive receptor kinase n=1 Tax=Cinnamomum micranthum f. kanehirae TaxID=337451 RepID=A0A443PQK8_9MAGN|nr:putative inactive receptor kinase [Cinnamomum micranthum f. kanehirae]
MARSRLRQRHCLRHCIDLTGLGLVGDLKFLHFDRLRMLRNLSLSGNSLTGRIVPAIGSMSSSTVRSPPDDGAVGLGYLNLSLNNFTGWFSQWNSESTAAEGFWISIRIGFPLRNVEFLDFSCNSFYGGLGLDSQNLFELASTARFVNLSYMDWVGSSFSDESFRIYNQLTGKLPSFDSLPSLRVLRVGNNQLSGSIPEELLSSSLQLEELDLSSNGFSGSIQGVNSTSLKVLNLSSNSLQSSLPSKLGSCVAVDLSKNMIYGDISSIQSWGDMLTTIDLSFNNLSGVIPSSLFTSLTLTSLHLSGNHLTGTIPLQSSDSIESLALPSNSHMESLDLSYNSLIGSLPPGIGTMVRLKLLNLGKNQLSGQIPSEINKLSELEYLDLSNNNFEGRIPDKLSSNLKRPLPENLGRFPSTSFRPGNNLLILPDGGRLSLGPKDNDGSGAGSVVGHRHPPKSSISVVIIVGSVVAFVMTVFVLLAYYRSRVREFDKNGFSSQSTGRDVKLGMLARPSLFRLQNNTEPVPTPLSFSSDHLLPLDARSSIPNRNEFVTEITECGFCEVKSVGSGPAKTNEPDTSHPITARKSSPGSTLPSSPHFIETCGPEEQPVMLNVYSPDRLAGELFFLDSSLVFTAEELSHAPAEVLGRSCHGTSYKATLDSGHMLTVKWLRVGLVKGEKEFSKEAKRIGIIRHPNIVTLRGYYWGPREQERLILTDYINGDSLALHLHGTTPRRCSPLSFSQRLKVAVDIARCLFYLHHDRGLPHGNLKPTNILLSGPDLSAQLTNCSLHRLITPVGTAEQILNLGALGYRAPELAIANKPFPSFKADVYAFGVILMELLTRRSAGDIISGQAGAVDLTDWVRLCANEGRGIDCLDRDITGAEGSLKAMDELLAISIRCILPVNERPNIRTVFEELCSITA